MRFVCHVKFSQTSEKIFLKQRLWVTASAGNKLRSYSRKGFYELI